MITPEDERPKAAPEDSVTIEVSDLDHRLCVLIRVLRAADGAQRSALAAVCHEGKALVAGEDAGLEAETAEPLIRWTCRMESEAVGLEAELEAVSRPVVLAEPLARAAAVERYEQLCRVRGELRVEGRRAPIDGVGRRAHAWGEPPAARFRSLYAMAGERAVTLTAVRPRGSSDHGAELVSAHLLRPQSDPEHFETARLSTIYDAAGHPRTAGLELFLAGEEYPRRVSGEAVCPAAGNRHSIEAACFRWSLDGDPAQGNYQVVAA
jgi:hypothetical protein